MKALLLTNNGKEKGLADSLLAAGIELVPGSVQPDGSFRCEPFDVALIDYPQGWGGLKLALAKVAHEQGKLVCSFPHGAGPVTQLDGIVPPCPYVDIELVPAEGFVEVYRRMGYPTRCEVIGWYFCEQRERSIAWADPHTTLFAPAHPFSGTEGTTFVPKWQEANRRVWEQFVELPGHKVAHLYGTWEANGLTPDDRVEVSVSDLSPALALQRIDEADAVIADPGTFARLAIARGRPTVMFGQEIRPHSDWGDREVANWEAWRDSDRYPASFEGGSLADALSLARSDMPELADWRGRFIGRQTDPQQLRLLLERLLAEKRPHKAPPPRGSRRGKKTRRERKKSKR